MKLFTATDQTQGQRPNDFHYCVDGELVIPPPLICDSDANDPDGGCGGGRSWAGLNTHRATTTAMIREIDGIDLDDYTEAVSSSLDQQGWDTSEACNIAERLAALAADHPVGSVFGRRLGVAYVRETPPT